MNGNYCVYAYVFDDGMTYVGLSRNLKKRKNSHRSVKHGVPRSAVLRYSILSGLDFPDMLVLETGLDKTEAQRTEDLYVMSLEPEMRLNKAKTGVAVGSLGKPENGRYLSPRERLEHEHASAKKYRNANKSRIANRVRAYRKDNHEHVSRLNHESYVRNRAHVMEYRKANRKRFAERDRKYRLDNIERIKAREKRYRESHKDIRDMRYRKWRNENTEHVREYHRDYYVEHRYRILLMSYFRNRIKRTPMLLEFKN